MKRHRTSHQHPSQFQNVTKKDTSAGVGRQQVLRGIAFFVALLFVAGCIGIQTRPGAGLVYIPILIPPTVTPKGTPDSAAIAKAPAAPITNTKAITASATVATSSPITSTVRPTKTGIATRAATSTLRPPSTPTRPPTATPTKVVPPKPTSTFTPAPPPEPTPLPRTAYIGRHNSFAEGSSLFVVGEIINGGQIPINGVRVLGSFFDSSGKLVAVQEATAVLPQSEPGMPNPFKLTVLGAASKIETYELVLAWDEITLVDYQILTIVSADIDEGEENEGEENEDEEGEPERKLVGLIRNGGATDVNDIIISLTLYNADGEIVDILQEIPRETTLSPNATTDFETLLPKGLEFEHFSIQAQGVLALF